MNIFGIGGLELLLLAAIAYFVLGPKRLLEGIREGRKLYSSLRRQRLELQSMITEAIDLEEIKKQIDSEGLVEEARELQEDLALDQVAEDVENAVDTHAGSVSRSRQLNRPPVKGDGEVRAAIPDLNLHESAGREAENSSAIEGDVDEVRS